MGGPFDTDMSEIVETNINRTGGLIEGRSYIRVQPCDGGSFCRCRRAIWQHRQSLVCDRYLPGRKFTFCPFQLQRKDELASAFPSILGQLRRSDSEIGECRGVGGGPLSALARDQVELGELVSLLSLSD